MNKAELAEKIRILRKTKGLRQEDLAAKAGVSIRVIKDLESASGNPTVTSLDLIGSVLGTPIYKLLSPGIESISVSADNSQQPITSEESTPPNKIDRPAVAVEKVLLAKGPHKEKTGEEHKGDAGKPPHKLSEHEDEVVHADSSDVNSNDLTRAERILKIQAKILKLSDKRLEYVDEFLNDLEDLENEPFLEAHDEASND